MNMVSKHIIKDAGERNLLELFSLFLQSLAKRAPAGCPSCDFIPDESFARKGTFSAVLPTAVEEPVCWWVTTAFAYRCEGSGGDEAGFFPKGLGLHCRKLARRMGGMDAGSPEDFIDHPVADPRKELLQ